jgi:ribosomal protein S18 acetylase RimI-like enzyme
MIELLDHSAKDVANQIYGVFQQSYRVEAGLVGVADEEFPPLRRSAPQIQASGSQFLGARIGSGLAAVIELSYEGEHLGIDSLVVRPKYFRRGLAGQLLQSALDEFEWQSADVETAAANAPAISLYMKFGFSKARCWKTDAGIDKVLLSRRKST